MSLQLNVSGSVAGAIVWNVHACGLPQMRLLCKTQPRWTPTVVEAGAIDTVLLLQVPPAPDQSWILGVAAAVDGTAGPARKAAARPVRQCRRRLAESATRRGGRRGARAIRHCPSRARTPVVVRQGEALGGGAPFGPAPRRHLLAHRMRALATG